MLSTGLYGGGQGAQVVPSWMLPEDRSTWGRQQAVLPQSSPQPQQMLPQWGFGQMSSLPQQGGQGAAWGTPVMNPQASTPVMNMPGWAPAIQQGMGRTTSYGSTGSMGAMQSQGGNSWGGQTQNTYIQPVQPKPFIPGYSPGGSLQNLGGFAQPITNSFGMKGSLLNSLPLNSFQGQSQGGQNQIRATGPNNPNMTNPYNWGNMMVRAQVNGQSQGQGGFPQSNPQMMQILQMLMNQYQPQRNIPSMSPAYYTGPSSGPTQQQTQNWLNSISQAGRDWYNAGSQRDPNAPRGTWANPIGL